MHPISNLAKPHFKLLGPLELTRDFNRARYLATNLNEDIYDKLFSRTLGGVARWAKLCGAANLLTVGQAVAACIPT